MLEGEDIDILKETLAVCALHHERMMFAYDELEDLFPMDEDKYIALQPVQLSFCDQLIYRFSKLQDSIGNKLFKIILAALKEDVQQLPFIDILNRLEKLQLIDDAEKWLKLREIRNQVTHEYPFYRDELIEGLNELIDHVAYLSSIWINLRDYSLKRFPYAGPSAGSS